MARGGQGATRPSLLLVVVHASVQPRAFLFQRPRSVGNGDRSFNMDSKCLTRFESSPGVCRGSCKTCGAPVFSHSDKGLDLIHVSVGLLLANERALLVPRPCWIGIETVSASLRSREEGNCEDPPTASSAETMMA